LRGAGQIAIANGDQNEEVEAAVTVEQQVRLNVQAGDDNDKPGAALDYTNFTIANGDPNEEVSNDVDSKVQAAITVEQPAMLNIGHGDDNDSGRAEVAPKLNIGASDPAEQA
jgi:hypothetical protein